MASGWLQAAWFQDARTVTLRERHVANGTEEPILEDTKSTEELRAVWDTRYGQAMEKMVDIA
jgi:hypothetical protein